MPYDNNNKEYEQLKKILHIQLFCKLSGVQKISLEILKNLGPEYDKYIIFSSQSCIGNMEETIQSFEDAGVTVIFVNSLVRELNLKKDFRALKQIYRICKEKKFDIVHTHSSKTGVLGRIAAKMAGVPNIVHTVHGVSFTKFTPKFKWLCYYVYEMFASLFCNRIVLVNEYYKKYFKYCPKKVSTIYNAIDYSSLNASAANVSKRSGDTIELLYVGRLDNQKDPLTMLLAFREVEKIHKNIRLTIVGDGDLTDECKNFVSESKLDDKVIFAGWKSNTSEYYANSDIFVSSSIYEAFGLTFLEAGYFKLPVVATNVEGIPEIVLDKKTGLLSNPRDYKAMARNIRKLCGDVNRRKALGNAGYKYVTKTFSVKEMVKEYEKLYNER
jgi:glycosyltransferase involved in cell wall biosynthesis